MGSGSSKALRNEGKVPCVLYGAGENVNFAVYSADFKNLVYTPNVYKVKLDVEGKNYDAILQDIQYHPVSDAIIHVDFLAVKADKPISPRRENLLIFRSGFPTALFLKCFCDFA